jgi:hypothetical protein
MTAMSTSPEAAAPVGATSPTLEPAGLGWPTTPASVDVSRETPGVPAGLGWPSA